MNIFKMLLRTLDFKPGWKGGVLAVLIALREVVNLVLVDSGRDPLLLGNEALDTAAMLVAAGLFLAQKWFREREGEG